MPPTESYKGARENVDVSPVTHHSGELLHPLVTADSLARSPYTCPTDGCPPHLNIMCRTVKLLCTQPSGQVVESGYQTQLCAGEVRFQRLYLAWLKNGQGIATPTPDPHAGVGCPYLTGTWEGSGTGRGRMEVLIESLSIN